MDYSNVNFWAVLVSAIISMMIGGIWYSPALFGKLLMEKNGTTPEDVANFPKSVIMRSYILQFIASLVTTFVLAELLALTGAATFGSAVGIALLVWLGFIATVHLGAVLWEKKSPKLFLVDLTCSILIMIISATILYYWK